MTSTSISNKAAGKGIGRGPRLWAGFLVLIAAAIAFAWYGAGSLRPEQSASGLEFRTVRAGTGPTIQQQDAALINYVGTLDDGTVFDSSQGQARPFTPMATIPGFAEAMARMQKGGLYKVRLPAALGYGAEPPPGIPQNAPLNFEVEVVELAPGMGPMLIQQMQAQQGAQGR